MDVVWKPFAKQNMTEVEDSEAKKKKKNLDHLEGTPWQKEDRTALLGEGWHK